MINSIDESERSAEHLRPWSVDLDSTELAEVRSTNVDSLQTLHIFGGWNSPLQVVATLSSFAKNLTLRSLLTLPLALLIACSSGSSDNSGGAEGTNAGCDGSCANQRLEASDVELILRQATTQAQTLGLAATISIVDRVGNVLAVYQMPGANAATTISGQIGAQGGLEGASVPAALAAISKAGTGAFLSSQGNAFSTRTAGQIVQEHFNPGEDRTPGGPLFGVQFSQLICSDVTVLDGSSVGPRPLPLGLSADPGGIPLYKNGDVVGGIGVELDGLYTFDRNILDRDDAVEERVALAGSIGFEAPSERSADAIYVLGKTLRFTDLNYSDIAALPETLPPLDPSGLTAIGGFFNGTIRGGVIFGEAASGVVKTTRGGLPAAVLVNAAGVERYGAHSGASLGGAELQTSEVDAILNSALLTAHRARAAIRRPLDTPARVSIWVVDHLGNPLGFVRSEDAPVFGIDVALQKARTAAFFSSPDAGSVLERGGYGDYVARARSLLGATALSGTHAFADRSGGNLSRPFFPDGIETNAPGPFSLPFPGSSFDNGVNTWSPFNTGLQLDITINAILAPLAGSIPDNCANSAFGRRLNNGTQIFPGSVPLYRGNTLIGAIGISGDGIDQDDLIAFYGASRRGLDAIGRSDVGDPVLGFNAPQEMRADKINVNFENIRLRYVNCPEAPFAGSNEHNVCDGL